MAGDEAAGGSSYSSNVGTMYVFNLIVGAGALTIPHAFAQVGMLLGTCFLFFLALLGCISAEFVVEGMALSNALIAEQLCQSQSDHLDAVGNAGRGANEKDEHNGQCERVGLVSERPVRACRRFDIVKKVEMSEMVRLFLGRRGKLLFYLCIITYLYGDLAIYAVALPKCLRDLVCPLPPHLPTSHSTDIVWDCIRPPDHMDSHNFTATATTSVSPLGAWLGEVSGCTLNSMEVYHCFCALFSMTFGPCAFVSMTKSKWVQLITTVLRHVAFFTMIIVASIAPFGIAKGSISRSPSVLLEQNDLSALPRLFGVAIYSFMCHHSIPSMIFPIQDLNSTDLGLLLRRTYTAVLVVYLAFTLTATFRFPPDHIHDLYTLNFAHYKVHSVAIFLSLFPLAAMGSVFPIICVSLRENLKMMLLPGGVRLFDASRSAAVTVAPAAPVPATTPILSTFGWWLENLGLPLLTVVPPVALSFFTTDLGLLVSLTGSYPGVCIQWLFPALIVYHGRRHFQNQSINTHGLASRVGVSAYDNPHKSTFMSMAWIYGILAWSLVSCLTFTYLNAKKLMDAAE